MNRQIALLLFASFFGWLGARSVEQALARTVQAKIEAATEKQVARDREADTEVLKGFIEEIVEAFSNQANGRFQLLPARASKRSFDFNPYVDFINGRLRWFKKRYEEQDFWMQGPIAQAALNLSHRLDGLLHRGLNMRLGLTDPTIAQTGVELIDKIDKQIYALLQNAIPNPDVTLVRQELLDRVYLHLQQVAPNPGVVLGGSLPERIQLLLGQIAPSWQQDTERRGPAHIQPVHPNPQTRPTGS